VRRTGIRIAELLGVTLLVLSSLALAQDLGEPPKAPTPDEMPGTQLIVWTETQKPHPVPETSTEMYAAASQAQLMSGMILAEGSDLFLTRADHPALRIENNEATIGALAGEQVRIYGNVDPAAKVVYVLNIAQL
jgi:hypothetical protein